MAFRTFSQLALAQALMLWRNITFWLISIFIAVLSMLVFGWLFKPEAQAFDLAVVDEDHTESSQSLTAAFAGLNNIKFTAGERESELAELKDGDRGAVVIIPAGFGEGLTQGHAGIDVYYETPTSFASATLPAPSRPPSRPSTNKSPERPPLSPSIRPLWRPRPSASSISWPRGWWG